MNIRSARSVFHLLAIVFCLSLLTTRANAQSTQSALRIVGGFTPSGVLKWTNDVLTTAPVYSVFRSTTVTGAWTQLRSVTNQTSTVLTNPLAPAEFYRVLWASDVQTTFDYAFDEGYGVPAAVGQLKLTFVPGPALGTWSVDEFIMVDYLHPLGDGSFVAGGVTVNNGVHTVALAFTPLVGDGGVFLVAELDIGTVGGKAAYTGFSGYVYANTFTGVPELIGYCAATRR